MASPSPDPGTRESSRWAPLSNLFQMMCSKRRGIPWRSFPTPEIVFREIEIFGSHWATLTDMIEVMEMVARGILDPIIVREYALEQAAEALDLLASGAGPGRTVL